jgi:hypothetical protein
MLSRMADPIPIPSPASSWRKRIVMKGASLVLLGLVFGFAYGWAAPRLYDRHTQPGFGLGMVHGALMPIALPALLMGKDVPIFTAQAAGRIYKIGYIAGINLCGLVFFGTAFCQPGKRGVPRGQDLRQ